MIVVVHFCAKDAWLAEKNLKWCILLEGKTRQHAVLACDTETPKDALDRIRSLAREYFSNVDEYVFGAPRFKTWPWAPNHCWQTVARYMPQHYKDSWFWWEADATPLRANWLNDIEDEYNRAKKPFMGAFIKGVVPWGHMNGCGVYPSDPARFTVQAFLQTTNKQLAWDVAMSKEIIRSLHNANHLFQHCWTWDKDGLPSLGGNIEPSFKTWPDVSESPHRVDFRHALYHRCKDGSIIDRCMEQIAIKASESQNAAKTVGVTKTIETPKIHSNGSCRILIVTYRKDFPWLDYSIRSIHKFCSGFSGVTVAIPRVDVDLYNQQIGPRKGVKLYLYDEIPGKGMLQHMERICSADQICVKDQFILHVDADCIFHDPVTPDEYIVKDRPVYVFRSYDSLIDSKTGRVSDCHQWKSVVRINIGEEPEVYSMCRHPSCFPVDFYPTFRLHVETVHKMPFKDYVLSCRNEFPQTFAEFPAMGAWAWNHMRDRFYWVDVVKNGAPKDRLKAFWSHSGLDARQDSNQSLPTPRMEIETMLS